jgi:hypothetical protein
VELCVERAGAGDFSKLHVTESLPSDIGHTTNCKMGLHEIRSPPSGVFVKELRNTAGSFVITVRPSVRSFTLPHGETRLPSDGFASNFILGVLLKFFATSYMW